MPCSRPPQPEPARGVAEQAMSLATATLGLLERSFAQRPAPRVRALHLPPRPWNGSKDGEFGAIELESGALGLSYLLLDDTLARIGDAGRGVVGANALQLARHWVQAPTPALSALGFAAVNALTRELFDRAAFRPPTATDSIGGLDPQPAEHIGMVGYFPPLLAPVTQRGARLTVLELRADLVGVQGPVTVTLDPAQLAGCTQVLCTSTVLLNHTLEGVRAACRAARRFVLVGPGASCLPDALFDAGVTALGGSWIDDAPRFCDALASGGKWSAAARKFLLTAQDYPGALALARG